MERIKNNVLNCPNCGAPITGANCEYCGSVFYDFANIDADGISYVRMRVDGKLFIFRAAVVRVHSRFDYEDDETVYFDNTVLYKIAQPRHKVNIEMEILPNDRGVLLEAIDKGRSEDEHTD